MLIILHYTLLNHSSSLLQPLPTGTSETTTNIMPTQDLTTTTSLEANDDEFSTPDNHSGVPLIQPFSQSPHVLGKTPRAANTMMKSKLFTSTTAPASIATDSPSHYASVTTENSTSQNIDSNSFTIADGNLHVASKSTDSTTGQHDVEYSMEHSSEQVSSDGKDDVKEKNVDTIVSDHVISKNTVDKDRDLQTTAVTNTAEIRNENNTISDTAYVHLDAANLTKGSSYIATYVAMCY